MKGCEAIPTRIISICCVFFIEFEFNLNGRTKKQCGISSIYQAVIIYITKPKCDQPEKVPLSTVPRHHFGCSFLFTRMHTAHKFSGPFAMTADDNLSIHSVLHIPQSAQYTHRIDLPPQVIFRRLLPQLFGCANFCPINRACVCVHVLDINEQCLTRWLSQYQKADLYNTNYVALICYLS